MLVLQCALYVLSGILILECIIFSLSVTIPIFSQ
jgi:hypothetical protein